MTGRTVVHSFTRAERVRLFFSRPSDRAETLERFLMGVILKLNLLPGHHPRLRILSLWLLLGSVISAAALDLTTAVIVTPPELSRP